MAIATVDMKHGMQVTLSDSYGKPMEGTWEVLDRHPLQRNWWLHRWNDGVWQTTHAHESSMSADVSTLAAPVSESAKWTKAPFNVAHKDSGATRKTGYVLGKWGAHKREDTFSKDWTITHLPTGLSVNTRQTLPLARAVMEQLATLELPELDSLEFGSRPNGQAKADTDKIIAVLQAA